MMVVEPKVLVADVVVDTVSDTLMVAPIIMVVTVAV